MSKTLTERLNNLYSLWGAAKEEEQEGEAKKPSCYQIQVVEVNDLNDLERVLRFLQREEPVIVDLAKISDEDKRSVFDFVYGMVYALNGSLEKIRESTLVIIPDGVEVSDDTIWYSLYR